MRIFDFLIKNNSSEIEQLEERVKILEEIKTNTNTKNTVLTELKERIQIAKNK